MWQSLKRKKLLSAPFPAEWRQFINASCPFFNRLPVADQKELEGFVKIFLAEKQFEGCGGFIITDEVRLCIATHACLLLLHRPTDFYPRLRSILVYPNVYFVPCVRHIGSGILEEMQQQRAGESWAEGAVVLAWDVVCDHISAPEYGHNLVWHEFAHQLDFEDGAADGVPVLGRGESFPTRRRRHIDWARVMRSEFKRLKSQLQRGENTILRDYAATNAAEFFAVATECFFGRPQPLRQLHPELYAEMKWYYQQDPAAWDWNHPAVRGN